MRTLIRLMALVACASFVQRLQADPPNGIRAVVDDKVITSDEVGGAVETTAKRLSLQFSSTPEVFQTKLNELIASKQDELVSRQLILHEFKTAGYGLPESVIDELVQEKIRDQFHDRGTLTKTLQEEGLTYEKFRQQTRDQFIVVAMRQKNITSEIIISPHKIEVYYEAHKDDYKLENEVKLRMIVLNKSSSPDGPNALKVGEEILAKLKEGASWDEMAIHSDRKQRTPGPEKFEISRLRKELADAVAKLKSGERSGVIDAPDACYIVQVDEVLPAHIRSLSEVRDEIEKDLKTLEQSRLEKQWIERLKKKTFIRYF